MKACNNQQLDAVFGGGGGDVGWESGSVSEVV